MGGILGAVNEAETHGGTEGKDTQVWGMHDFHLYFP